VREEIKKIKEIKKIIERPKEFKFVKRSLNVDKDTKSPRKQSKKQSSPGICVYFKY